MRMATVSMWVVWGKRSKRWSSRDGVAGGGEGGEVGGEGFGRAGDVDEGGRGDAGEQVADFAAGAGARRVEDDEVGAVALEDGGAEEVERGGFDGVAVGSLVEARAVKAGSAISTAVMWAKAGRARGRRGRRRRRGPRRIRRTRFGGDDAERVRGGGSG